MVVVVVVNYYVAVIVSIIVVVVVDVVSCPLYFPCGCSSSSCCKCMFVWCDGRQKS